jgi:hypothetical protein
MEYNVVELLSARIQKHCSPLWNDGYFKHAAHEAMILVEQALKEKGLTKENYMKFGQTLITSLFRIGGKETSVKLRVPLGEDLQTQAEAFFQGVFSYYRNYTAHDGSKIDNRISLRIMIIASELLELIDSSALSFSDIGGVNGLLAKGVFENKEQLSSLLASLSGYFPDGDLDGLREELFEKHGILEHHLEAVLELDLVRYNEDDYFPDEEEMRSVWINDSPPQTLGHFELTELGERFVSELRKESFSS